MHQRSAMMPGLGPQLGDPDLQALQRDALLGVAPTGRGPTGRALRAERRRRQVELRRQAETPGRAHIEEGYESRGVPEKETKRRARATVNKQDHDGKKSGFVPHGRRPGGRAAASPPAAERSKSAKRPAAPRRARGTS